MLKSGTCGGIPIFILDIAPLKVLLSQDFSNAQIRAKIKIMASSLDKSLWSVPIQGFEELHMFLTIEMRAKVFTVFPSSE